MMVRLKGSAILPYSLVTKGFVERNQSYTLTFVIFLLFALPLLCSWNNHYISFYERFICAHKIQSVNRRGKMSENTNS